MKYLLNSITDHTGNRLSANPENGSFQNPQLIQLITLIMLCLCMSAWGQVKQVKVAKVVMEYIVGISDASRNSSKLFSGVSPRASLNLMRMSQAFAAISGRDFVTPDDVRFLAPYVYSHRVMTGAGAVRLKDVRDIITEVASTVAVPTEDWKK